MPHTPGPWLLRTGQRTAYIDTERDNTLLILRPYSAEGGADFSANAALIAAAPDLLTALRQAETIIADHVAGVERTAWPEVLRAIRTATTKAEGK